MNPIEFSVRRPIAATMFVLIIMVLGAVAFTQLKIDLFSDIQFPLIAVITAYPGAGPEEVENYISRPVEDAVSTVKHLKHVRSISRENLSVVTVEFEWGVNMDYAALEVREKVDPVIERLPDDAKRPVISKFDPNVMIPFMMVMVTGPQDLKDLRELSEDVIRKKIEKINGVGGAAVVGGKYRHILVRVDEKKLKALGIAVQQVMAVLKQENITLTGGRLDEGKYEFQTRVTGEYKNLEQIRRTAVAEREGQAVFIEDVAEVLVIELTPATKRKRTQQQIQEDFRAHFREIPGATLKLMDINAVLQGGQAEIELRVSGDDMDTLGALGQELKERFRKVAGLYQLDLTWEPGNPEYRITIDRDKAGSYGVSTALVASTIRALVKGEDVTKFREKGKEYDITLQAGARDRDWIERLKEAHVVTPAGLFLPLSEIARVVPASGPSEITREDRQRYIGVTAAKTQRPLGDIIRDMNAEVRKVHFPAGYIPEQKGTEKQRKESFDSLFLALIAGILLIYFILAAQFESLVHPFVIMLSIPLEVVGVFLALILTKTPLSIMAFLGILMLTGIVVSNAILLVNYTNILRDRGMSQKEALLEAGPVRLRPILMTAVATIFAMIPMALAAREGAEMFRPLALTVIGGLTTSTFLTLLVVPVAYSVLDDLGKRLGMASHEKSGAAKAQ